MPGRYKTTTPVLDFQEMALMNFDQDFSPADDIFSYWNSPDCRPETCSFSPRDVTTASTAVSPLGQCNVNSLGVLVDRPTGQWSSSGSSPIRQSGGFCFYETFQSTEHTEIQDDKSPNTQHTSLCGIKPQTTAHVPACALRTISPSPSALKTELSCSDGLKIERAIEPARRKRGPKMKRGRTSSSSPSSNATSASTSVRRPACLPHKQVERKYREGLNLELERLRKAVPTLLQSTDSCVIGVAKPSKGMVLAAAIKYISKIELERDSAFNEVERLGGKFRFGKLNR